jgi:predicted phosphodiesterase
MTWAAIAEKNGLSSEALRNRVRRGTLGALSAPAGEGYKPIRSERPTHPSGWEPGIDTARGVIVAAPSTSGDVVWDDELRRLGFDPEEFEIVEPFQVRTWEGFHKDNDGEAHKVQLWYRRASIIRRRAHGDRVDIEALTSAILAAPKPPKRLDGDQGFTFVWADAQIGKGDGDGSSGIVERMVASIDAGIARLNELRAAGRKIGLVHFHVAADLYEATSGHYAMQTFSTDLNLREQRAAARRLVLAAVTRFAQTGCKVLVTVVPGNHTENRLNGKAYTTFGDSGDVEIVEQVAEICAANPTAYGNVRFVVPREEMELTVDVCGTIVGLAHGHQMKGGVVKWWKDQMLGRQPIGDADILITGHLHTALIQQLGDRWHFQAPTLESESTWFKHTRGDGGHPGVLTFVTGGHRWADLQIL